MYINIKINKQNIYNLILIYTYVSMSKYQLFQKFKIILYKAIIIIHHLKNKIELHDHLKRERKHFWMRLWVDAIQACVWCEVGEGEKGMRMNVQVFRGQLWPFIPYHKKSINIFSDFQFHRVNITSNIEWILRWWVSGFISLLFPCS